MTTAPYVPASPTDGPTLVCMNPIPVPPVDPPTFRIRTVPMGIQPPDRVGHYHVLRQVGCGGMGIVYEGYDSRLKRPVAIKMIRDTGGPDAADLHARFQTEAEAVAQLHHPNIVQIFEVGQEGGRPFVALEYLPGGSLLAKTGNKPQPPRDAAEVVRVIAAAMHHAHRNGVVHRDLKPANILFDDAGNAKVTDFGAARVTFAGANGDIPGSALTRVGEVIGTPQYMAPEQARGTPDAATPAIDVYALGAVLYQLLTGRPPFDGPDAFETLRMVLSTEPVSPRHLQPNVPRDLETICLKCLEKHPAKRYDSAEALAVDLGRYLAGETIRAKPATALEKVWKKAQRRPVETGLLAGMVLFAVAGFAGVMVQWQEAVGARNDAERSAAEAQESEAKTARALGAAERAEETATREKLQAERDRDAAATAERAAAAALGQSRLALAADLWDKGEVEKAESLIDARPAAGVVRDWEWHYVRGTFHTALWEIDLTKIPGARTASQWVMALAVSPDGTRVVVAAWDPYPPAPGQPHRTTLYLIRLADGTAERVWRDVFPFECNRLVWQSAERFVSCGADRVVRVWDVADESLIFQTPRKGLSPTLHPVVSPDGRAVVWPAADGSLAVWDATTGRTGLRLAVPGERLHPAGVADGTVLTRDDNHVFYVFDAGTGTQRFAVPFAGSGSIVSPDGRVVVSGTVADVKGRQRVGTAAWDAVTGKELWRRRAPRDGGSWLVAAPDGRHIFDCKGGSGDVRVWETLTGDLGYRLRGQNGIVNAADVSPDGRTLATAADDCTVVLWNIRDGAPLQTIRGHRSGVRGVGFTPDGTRLVTGGADGRILLWDLSRQTQPYRVVRGTGLRHYYPGLHGAMTFTADGRLRAADTTHGLVDFDPATVNPLTYRPLSGDTKRHQWNLVDWAFTPDGKRLVAPMQDPEPLFFNRGDPAPHLALGGAALAPAVLPRWRAGIVAVWDGETGKLVRQFDRCPSGVFATAISPDGVHAAAYVNETRPGRTAASAVFVWEVETGKLVRREEMSSFGAALAFSPDSRTLVAAVDRVSLGVNLVSLDLTAGTRTDWPATTACTLRPLTFSADGKSLAGSCERTGKLVVWDVAARDVKWQTKTVRFTHLAFGPDGRRLASVNYTGTVTLWDAATGHEAYSLTGAAGRVMDHAHPARVAFSPDGKYLAANQHDGTTYVWAADRDPSPGRRREEADAARFWYHLTQAREAADQRDRPFGVQFQMDRLQPMTPPTDAIRQEYEGLRRWLVGPVFRPIVGF